jgi:hypothetical protein
MKKSDKKAVMAENQSDHDILITLVATVRNNNVTVLEKIEDVKQKVQEVNDGVNAKVNDHELRIKALEHLVQLTNPEEAIKQLQDVVDWKKKFQLIWWLIVGLSLMLGFILSQVSTSLKMFN